MSENIKNINENVKEEVLVEQVKAPRKYKSVKRANLISTILAYVLLVVLSVIWLYPILWIVLQAFRVELNDQGEIIGTVVSNYFPKRYGLDNFIKLFTETFEDPLHAHKVKFITWFGNTLLIAVCSCVFSTILVLSVAYCMSKLRFKARKPLMNVSMILGLFPGFMSMVAMYYILKAMHLTQSLVALILVNSAGAGMGFQIAKGYFDIVPNSLVESARLDGCSNFQIFYKIILPLSKPIIIYTALMSFTGPWMDFIFARVILGVDNTHLHTVAVGLYYMLYGQKADSNVFTTFAAGCVCIAVPIVTLFMCLQRYYVEGVTSGSVKG